ncbi:MAG TPA: hypothetical protein VJ875_16350 [Pyrinomonadaceae bacterium]|nr:hypothetical protein [Pyrinomonadaceae bacterium]
MSEHSSSKNGMPPDDRMVHDNISQADLDESLQMLHTRVGQVNAVFACFGSAAQHAQHFEAALAGFLSDYNKLTKQGSSTQEFEELDQKLQKKTLGTLLREFSKYVTIQDPNVVGFLEMALEKRNFLMHHFFRQREGKLRLERDRMELLSELTAIDNILDQAATITRAMQIAMSRATSTHKPDDELERDQVDQSKALFAATVKMPDDPEQNNN